MKRNHAIVGGLLLAISILNFQPSTCFAQGTAFTYQRQLNSNGGTANGLYDLRFMVWDALTNGNMIAGPLTNSATGVTNGLFVVTLDFGPGVFTGPWRWLELDVRTNGNGAFTPLLPRQQLLPVPYATCFCSRNNANQILTTVIALLAVLFGPILSWLISRRQTTTSLAVANKQITAPMRQAWINALRDLTADLTSRSLHYYVAGYEDRSDAEYQQLTLLEHKIALMLNAAEPDHQQFEQSIRQMISSLGGGKVADTVFVEAHDRTRALARVIFKREWNRVKDPIEGS
jgi:hypothetical protein